MPHAWVTGYVITHKQLADPGTNVHNLLSHPTDIICIWYFPSCRHNKNVMILSKYCHFAFLSRNIPEGCLNVCTTFLIFRIYDHPNILSVGNCLVVALGSQKTGINLPVSLLGKSSCWISLLHLILGISSIFSFFGKKLGHFHLWFFFFHIQLFLNCLSNKDAASSLLFPLFTY